MIILIPMTHNTSSQQLIIKDSQISDLSNKKEKKQIESESLWERERAVIPDASCESCGAGQGLCSEEVN